jgi:hypothetical protein
MLSLREKGCRERSGRGRDGERGKGSVFRLFEELLTLRLCACRFEGHPIFFFLVVHPACWGRSQPQGSLVIRKLLLEMLSKVDNSTETPWD